MYLHRVFCRTRGATQGLSVYRRSILRTPYTTAVPATNGQDLIHKLDLRVGKIVQVDHHPQADHLYVEQVNLDEKTEEGAPHTRTIVSGLVKYINSQDMLVGIAPAVCKSNSILVLKFFCPRTNRLLWWPT